MVWWYPLPDWDLKENWLRDRGATWGLPCQTSPGGREGSRQGWQPWHVSLRNSQGGIDSLAKETNRDCQTALHLPDRPLACRWEDLMKALSKVSQLFHPQSFSKNTWGTNLSHNSSNLKSKWLTMEDSKRQPEEQAQEEPTGNNCGRHAPHHGGQDHGQQSSRTTWCRFRMSSSCWQLGCRSPPWSNKTRRPKHVFKLHDEYKK